MRINIEKLEQLYQHASQPQEKLLHERFHFGWFNYGDDKTKNGIAHCGTLGCLLGELPAIEPRVTLSPRPCLSSFCLDDVVESELIIANEIFGVNGSETRHLFYPNAQRADIFGGKMLDTDATKEQVLANLREFIDNYKAGKFGND